MKRLPIVLTLVALIALAASVAFWILQFYKPAQRPIAAAPAVALPDPSMDAAATLFGGQAVAEVAANYSLTGVIADGPRSVAIISANGAPAKALAVGKELAPGVSVTEVHPRYVMLSDGGVMKRIDLAPDTKAAAPMGGATPAMAPAPGGGVREPQMDAGIQAGHGDVGIHDQPNVPSATNPPLNTGVVPQVTRPAQPTSIPAPAAPVTPPGSSVTPITPSVAPVGTPSAQPVQMPQPVRSPNAPPVPQAPTSR